MLCEGGEIGKLTTADWAFEGKWDGYRLLVEADHGALKLSARSGRDVTAEFPTLAGLAGLLGDWRVALDGEVVALDENGVPQFENIQNHRRWPRVEFWAFDILALEDRSLTATPYGDRRKLLEAFGQATGITVPDLIPVTDGAAAMLYSADHGWEGVVAKKLTSTYEAGRSPLWLKDKHWLEREVVICGWRDGEGNREGLIGSLLMGVPDGDGGLSFVGRVGTGFTAKDLRYLQALLTPLSTTLSPFSAPIPSDEHRRANYTEPVVVGEVRYALQTADGRMRFSSWRGIRSDKTPATIN